MRNLEEQMSFYAAYHQNARNKATHFVGVPAIMLSLFIPLAWIRFEVGGVTLSAAMLFAALFVGGWILQLVGHVFEGRKPALADNLFQIFVAPIFLAAEVFFALGYKPALRRGVEEKAQLRRAQSADSSTTLTRTSSMSGADGSRSA
jgi:uncharacterized membrane protein YGL010W